MTTQRTIQPSRPEAGMHALCAEVDARGFIAVQRDCHRALRMAWAHRHDSHRAPMVIRANVATLRDLTLVMR